VHPNRNLEGTGETFSEHLETNFTMPAVTKRAASATAKTVTIPRQCEIAGSGNLRSMYAFSSSFETVTSPAEVKEWVRPNQSAMNWE